MWKAIQDIKRKLFSSVPEMKDALATEATGPSNSTLFSLHPLLPAANCWREKNIWKRSKTEIVARIVGCKDHKKPERKKV